MTGDGWRRAREATGKTLRGLAAECGISAPFQSDVEHGRRRYSNSVEARIRVALGLEPKSPEPKNLCVVCEEPLVANTWSEYLGDPMLMIIGPGHAAQRVQRHVIYCQLCGLLYHVMPRAPKPKRTK
jgi:transcriptional regulator with XRE-family HTH domain